MLNDIFTGKVLITGGTSGLGLELVKLFLRSGYYVITTGRHHIEIPGFDEKYKVIVVDFSDLVKVAEFAKKICSIHCFDIVVNNAGVFSPPRFIKTVNGLEYSFQVNFIAHLLLNEVILSTNDEGRVLRIASVTSPVHRLAGNKLSALKNEEGYSVLKAYSSSKLYLTFLKEVLENRFPDLNFKCISFDPGTFSSGIYRNQKKWFRIMYIIAAPFMKSPTGVARRLFDILVKEEIIDGAIYGSGTKIGFAPDVDQEVKSDFFNACNVIVKPFLNLARAEKHV
jgi:NAD(P)-dependent dehydrogenase (short-subunit alcohol dehydrogenase family)